MCVCVCVCVCVFYLKEYNITWFEGDSVTQLLLGRNMLEEATAHQVYN